MTFTHPDNAPEGHKWQTHEGEGAHYVGLDRNGWYVFQIDDDDINNLDAFSPHNVDEFIIDAPRPKRVIEGWVNVYPTASGKHFWPQASLYSSKDVADRSAIPDRLACIHIRAEEGEGL
jgi:hypothetical protein